MKLLNKLVSPGVLRVGGVFALGAALGMAAAAVVYVAADRLDVVDKPRAVAKVVATVDRNTALNVVSQKGKWYEVEVNGQKGFVFEKAVASQPGGKKAEGVALSDVKAGPISGLEQAAAARGVTPGAKQYSSAKGLSTSGLEQLINDRRALSPAEYDRFQTEGGLRGASAAAGEEEIERLALTREAR